MHPCYQALVARDLTAARPACGFGAVDAAHLEMLARRMPDEVAVERFSRRTCGRSTG